MNQPETDFEHRVYALVMVVCVAVFVALATVREFLEVCK
jgi:hypothetical protein